MIIQAHIASMPSGPIKRSVGFTDVCFTTIRTGDFIDGFRF